MKVIGMVAILAAALFVFSAESASAHGYGGFYIGSYGCSPFFGFGYSYGYPYAYPYSYGYYPYAYSYGGYYGGYYRRPYYYGNRYYGHRYYGNRYYGNNYYNKGYYGGGRYGHGYRYGNGYGYGGYRSVQKPRTVYNRPSYSRPSSRSSGHAVRRY